MRSAVVLPLFVTLALLAACAGDKGPADRGAGKVRVVTSLGIFADFVRQVGGDRVDVTAVIPPGADPETFEPSPRDIRKIAQADAVFINGGGLESGFERAIVGNLRHGATLVSFADLFEGGNPHFWLSLDNAALYVRTVSETLSKASPADAATFQRNLEAYDRELSALAEGLRIAVASIPRERRKLVTTHDAFPHFADYLGLEVVGFVEPTEGQEPSPADVQRLVSAIEDQGVPAVFAEPGFTDRTLKQVAGETGVRICTLYSDALDSRVTTYVEMMGFNAAELARCLGGDAGG
ncbi:MAG TPA: metal ABC transporter substrate-binding protein [Dehalococcoidia bacterium]|nr:metal ABC transporter substrate-binding protein [Dehalococcoidia bacterium]